MGIQIKMLKDDANLAPEPVNVNLFVMKRRSVHIELARRDFFEPIDAAEQGALAGTGRSDNHDYFALFDPKVDILEDMEAAVKFTDVLEFDQKYTSLPM
jgi:hypothetical protein